MTTITEVDLPPHTHTLCIKYQYTKIKLSLLCIGTTERDNDTFNTGTATPPQSVWWTRDCGWAGWRARRHWAKQGCVSLVGGEKQHGLSLCGPEQDATSDCRILSLLNFPFAVPNCDWQWLLHRMRWWVEEDHYTVLQSVSGRFRMVLLLGLLWKWLPKPWAATSCFCVGGVCFCVGEYQGDLLSHVINLFKAIRKMPSLFSKRACNFTFPPKCLRVLFSTSSPMLPIFYCL